MVVVARSVPAGVAAEAAAFGGGVVRKAEAGAGRVLDDWDFSLHGRRLLLRQALLEGDEVDAGQWRLPRAGGLHPAALPNAEPMRAPALPHAARQKAYRDSDDGKHRHHQDGSGEHLDQL